MCSYGIQVSKGHSQCHALTLCKVQGKWCWRHVPLSATAVQVGHHWVKVTKGAISVSMWGLETKQGKHDVASEAIIYNYILYI